MSSTLHSVEYIKDERFDWWNQDFLRLLKARILGNKVATRLADFGVGEGHWSLSLVKAFDDIAEVTGIDRDPEWCKRAAAKYRQMAPHIAFFPVTADAHTSSLANAAFDVVTAQTLLMHSVTPQIILREMVRVAKPGAVILCAEPVNHMGWAQLFELRHYCSPTERARFYGIWISTLESAEASRGDQDMGLRLPTLLSRCGLENIRAWFNDRVNFEPASEFSLDFLQDELGREWVMRALDAAGVDAVEIAFVRAMIERVRAHAPPDVDFVVHAPMHILCAGTVGYKAHTS
jgi:SAM-dependent methyltransferase